MLKRIVGSNVKIITPIKPKSKQPLRYQCFTPYILMRSCHAQYCSPNEKFFMPGGIRHPLNQTTIGENNRGVLVGQIMAGAVSQSVN